MVLLFIKLKQQDPSNRPNDLNFSHHFSNTTDAIFDEIVKAIETIWLL